MIIKKKNFAWDWSDTVTFPAIMWVKLKRNVRIEGSTFGRKTTKVKIDCIYTVLDESQTIFHTVEKNVPVKHTINLLKMTNAYEAISLKNVLQGSRKGSKWGKTV